MLEFRNISKLINDFVLERISLGWTALLGAILLIILADRQDIETILSKIEWATLLFFTALFILMEVNDKYFLFYKIYISIIKFVFSLKALTKLGLINLIGKQTENIIMSVSESSRLGVAIVIILWV